MEPSDSDGNTLGMCTEFTWSRSFSSLDLRKFLPSKLITYLIDPFFPANSQTYHLPTISQECEHSPETRRKRKIKCKQNCMNVVVDKIEKFSAESWERFPFSSSFLEKSIKSANSLCELRCVHKHNSNRILNEIANGKHSAISWNCRRRRDHQRAFPI